MALAAPWQNGAHDGDTGFLTKGLGLFSLALGLCELAAPRSLARAVGLPDDDDTCDLLRACGLREITSGAGILTRPDPKGFVWSRVAGDVMDLAILGGAMTAPDANRKRLALAAAAVAGVTALDVMASRASRKAARDGALRFEDGEAPRDELGPSAVRIKRSITIARPAQELYQYWRTLENLPKIMSHLETVDSRDERHSHWQAKMLTDIAIRWDAEIIKDEPNVIIAWQSLEGSDIPNAGSVRFRERDDGRETELTVELYYQPPAGALGRALAKLIGQVPEVQLANDLRRFKQVMEIGEVLHSDASIHAGAHAAQPAENAKQLLLAARSPVVVKETLHIGDAS